MSNANRHDIHVLNTLIQSTLDTADGYRAASDESGDPGHRDLFARRGLERREVAEELQATVRALGGDPTSEGSILAKAQRAFADIKHALLGDELTVVRSVENGEDVLQGRFEKALEDSDISATTREAIRRAWDSVKSGHDQMRELKRSLEGRRDASNRLYPQ